MLFVKILASLVLILLVLFLAKVSFNLLFKLINALLRPVLMNTWRWCFSRNIPFPNLWEGPDGLLPPFIVTISLWLSIWMYVATVSYKQLVSLLFKS